jgi:hypothetical protein
MFPQYRSTVHLSYSAAGRRIFSQALSFLHLLHLFPSRFPSPLLNFTMRSSVAVALAAFIAGAAAVPAYDNYLEARSDTGT